MLRISITLPLTVQTTPKLPLLLYLQLQSLKSERFLKIALKNTSEERVCGPVSNFFSASFFFLMGKTGEECHDQDLTRASAMRRAAVPRFFGGNYPPISPSPSVLLYYRAPVPASSSAALSGPQCPCAECAVPPSIPSPSSPPVLPVSSLVPVHLSCPTSSPSSSSRRPPRSGTWSSLKAGSMGRGDRKAVAALISSSQSTSRSSPDRHVRPAGKVEGDISPTLCTPGSYPPMSNSRFFYVSSTFSSSDSSIPILDL